MTSKLKILCVLPILLARGCANKEKTTAQTMAWNNFFHAEFSVRYHERTGDKDGLLAEWKTIRKVAADTYHDSMDLLPEVLEHQNRNFYLTNEALEHRESLSVDSDIDLMHKIMDDMEADYSWTK